MGTLSSFGSPPLRVGRFPGFLLRLCAVSGGLLCLSFLFAFCFLFGCFFPVLALVVAVVLSLVSGVAVLGLGFPLSVVPVLRLSCRCLLRGSCWCVAFGVKFLPALPRLPSGGRGLFFSAVLVAARSF